MSHDDPRIGWLWFCRQVGKTDTAWPPIRRTFQRAARVRLNPITSETTTYDENNRPIEAPTSLFDYATVRYLAGDLMTLTKD